MKTTGNRNSLSHRRSLRALAAPRASSFGVRLALATWALLALAAVPALASSVPNPRGHWGAENALRFHLGEFEPRGDSSYWSDKAIDFSGDADDFSSVAAGVEYHRFLTQHLGVVASSNFFTGDTDQAYFDFVDERGADIFHTTELETATFQLGVLFNLTRRDRAVIPYAGGGGGLTYWRLAEFGDFIDFGDPDLALFSDTFEDDGTTFGWYWQAGVEFPLAPNVGAFLDGRWTRAKADLEGDFAGLGELDLSGRTLSLGVTWSF